MQGTVLANLPSFSIYFWYSSHYVVPCTCFPWGIVEVAAHLILRELPNRRHYVVEIGETGSQKRAENSNVLLAIVPMI